MADYDISSNMEYLLHRNRGRVLYHPRTTGRLCVNLPESEDEFYIAQNLEYHECATHSWEKPMPNNTNRVAILLQLMETTDPDWNWSTIRFPSNKYKSPWVYGNSRFLNEFPTIIASLTDKYRCSLIDSLRAAILDSYVVNDNFNISKCDNNNPVGLINPGAIVASERLFDFTIFVVPLDGDVNSIATEFINTMMFDDMCDQDWLFISVDTERLNTGVLIQGIATDVAVSRIYGALDSLEGINSLSSRDIDLNFNQQFTYYYDSGRDIRKPVVDLMKDAEIREFFIKGVMATYRCDRELVLERFEELNRVQDQKVVIPKTTPGRYFTTAFFTRSIEC